MRIIMLILMIIFTSNIARANTYTYATSPCKVLTYYVASTGVNQNPGGNYDKFTITATGAFTNVGQSLDVGANWERIAYINWYWNGTQYAQAGNSGLGYVAVASRISGAIESSATFGQSPTQQCTSCGATEDRWNDNCVPKCIAPETRNPNTGQCGYCPSQQYVNLNTCIPFCNRTAAEGFTGDIINQNGLCVVPACGSGEVRQADGKCHSNCDSSHDYVPLDGSCSLHCDWGYTQTSDGNSCESICKGQSGGEYLHPDMSCRDYPSSPCPANSTRDTTQGSATYGKCKADPLDCASGFEQVGNDCVQIKVNCGPNQVQQGTGCVDAPKKGETGTTTPDPGVPATPVTKTEPATGATPEEKASTYLKDIRDDQAKQIENDNKGNIVLKNIAENQKKGVDNSADMVKKLGEIVNDNKATNDKIGSILSAIEKQSKDSATQTSTIAGAVGGTTAAVTAAGGKIDGLGTKIDGLGTTISNKLDEMKSTQTPPDQPGLGEGLPGDLDYTEGSDAGALATERAGTNQQSMDMSSIGIFSINTTISQNACISGLVRNHPINICFDKPWMIVGYGIMKGFLIVIGYVQAIMLVNRAIQGG